MPSAVAKAPARRRNRKRKRRAASSSSSSSSTSSGSESDAEIKLTNTTTVPVKVVQAKSLSSDSSSESSSGSDSEPEERLLASPVVTSGHPPKPTETRHRSPSPSPPPAKLPTFLPGINKGENDTIAQEQLMKEKFKKFWMASIADGFRDDLEEIRKEPNLNPSRLSLLIDSLASGADVFSSSRSEKSAINEVEVILE